jgi:hypothetical protein
MFTNSEPAPAKRRISFHLEAPPSSPVTLTNVPQSTSTHMRRVHARYFELCGKKQEQPALPLNQEVEGLVHLWNDNLHLVSSVIGEVPNLQPIPLDTQVPHILLADRMRAFFQEAFARSGVDVEPETKQQQ